MIRGLVTGFVTALLVGLWAWRQPAHVHAVRHLVLPTTDVIEHAAVQTQEILNTIERESPWILKPNVKPSNNSSVQS
jgi:hypothetical protein